MCVCVFVFVCVCVCVCVFRVRSLGSCWCFVSVSYLLAACMCQRLYVCISREEGQRRYVGSGIRMYMYLCYLLTGGQVHHTWIASCWGKSPIIIITLPVPSPVWPVV